MNIYFKPTWLYIKQHNITELKYFGKTTRKSPFGYKGSGSYWKNHLRVHGNDLSTTWCQLFESREELIEYATKFSIENNIVESTDWANLAIENGIDGAFTGQVPWNKGKSASLEHRKNQGDAQRGKKKIPVSEERKKKQSETMKGRPGRIPSEEEITRRVQTRKENYERKKAQGISYAGPNNGFYGKKMSPESIAKREETKRLNRLLTNSNLSK
jgi:hypothetical protein